MSKTEELLSSLKDIHEPIPPESPSPVWMLIALLICIFLFSFFIRSFVKQKKKTPYWLEQINVARTEYPEQARLRLARLLRHTCLLRQDHELDNLTGDDWLCYLDRQFSTDYFQSGNGREFGDAMYEPISNNIDIHAICDHLSQILKRYQSQRHSANNEHPRIANAKQAQA